MHRQTTGNSEGRQACRQCRCTEERQGSSLLLTAPLIHLLLPSFSSTFLSLPSHAPPLLFPSPYPCSFVDSMQRNGCKRGILVVGGRFTNLAKAALAEVSPMVIEHFREEELLVDITEHELVPEHIILSTEEKAALLGRYKLKETQLPRIQVTDPVARFFGMQRGQVVKIVRPSETAGRYVTYRIVI